MKPNHEDNQPCETSCTVYGTPNPTFKPLQNYNIFSASRVTARPLARTKHLENAKKNNVKNKHMNQLLYAKKLGQTHIKYTQKKQPELIKPRRLFREHLKGSGLLTPTLLQRQGPKSRALRSSLSLVGFLSEFMCILYCIILLIFLKSNLL